MELRAPAKVNLHLAVGEKRPDGYHRIISIFQTCSLCDVLDATLEDGPFSVEVTGLEGICQKGRSTWTRRLFCGEASSDLRES